MIYFIPTPIGNMGDITIRSKELLQSVDALIVENFQSASLLLKILEIDAVPMFPFVKNDRFNEKQIIQTLEKYENIGVLSEAGMPSISDPGYLLVRYLIENKKLYSVLPGASSVTVAAAVSGFVKKGFVFLGFVPTKKGRQSFWQEAVEFGKLPVIFMESVHRIDKCLEDISQTYQATPDLRVCIIREASKIFEEYIHISVSELVLDKTLEFVRKGEFIIVIDSLV
jgi:16S rRNA (cytidine1402-2'-O)-methyltransferase